VHKYLPLLNQKAYISGLQRRSFLLKKKGRDCEIRSCWCAGHKVSVESRWLLTETALGGAHDIYVAGRQFRQTMPSISGLASSKDAGTLACCQTGCRRPCLRSKEAGQG